MEQFVCRAHAVLGGVADDHKSVGEDVEFDRFGKHNDNADRKHGELKPERYALAEMHPQIARGYLEIGKFDVQLLIFCKGVDEASDSAEKLRKHRCACSTRDSPTERFDEKHVECNVHNRRYQEKHKRSERVTDTAKYAYDKVVEQLRHYAEEYYEAVGVSGVEYLGILFGYVDPSKHRLYAEHGNKRQNHRHNGTEDKLRRK